MILPYIAAVSREVLLAVPASQREAASGLGATRWETVWSAVLPYGRAGIIGAVMLGLGRALGETMAVTMVIGNRHDIGASLLQPGYTMAAAIANEFTEATPRCLPVGAVLRWAWSCSSSRCRSTPSPACWCGAWREGAAVGSMAV